MARTLSPANQLAVVLLATISLLLSVARATAESPRKSSVSQEDSKSPAIANPFANSSVSAAAAPKATSFRNPFSAELDAPQAEVSLLPGPRSRWRTSRSQAGGPQPSPAPASSATPTTPEDSVSDNAAIALQLNPPLTSAVRDSATISPNDASLDEAVVGAAESATTSPPVTPVLRIPPLKRPPTPPEPKTPRPSSLAVKSAIVAAGVNLPADSNQHVADAHDPLLCDEPDTSTVQIILPRGSKQLDPTHSALNPQYSPASSRPDRGVPERSALRIKPGPAATGVEHAVLEQPVSQIPHTGSAIALPSEREVDVLDEPGIISDYANAPSSWLADAQETARTARTIDEFDAVVRLCQRVIDANPGENLVSFARKLAAWAHNRKGESLVEVDKTADALAQFQAAIEIDPLNSLAIHNRAVTLAQQDDFDAALIDFNRVIELNPGLAIAFRNRGELLAAQGHLDNAIADYTRAIEGLPDDAELRRARAHALQQQGQFEPALRDLDRSIHIAPNEAQGYVYRGSLLAERCDYRRALEDFSKAMSLDPQMGDAHRGLAWIKATCPDERLRDAFQALAAANMAVKLASPEDYSALDVLAAAHANAGEFDKAIAVQQGAINAAPREAVAPMQARLHRYQQGRPYRTAR